MRPAPCGYTSARWEPSNSPQVIAFRRSLLRGAMCSIVPYEYGRVGADASVRPWEPSDSPKICAFRLFFVRADRVVGPYKAAIQERKCVSRLACFCQN